MRNAIIFLAVILFANIISAQTDSSKVPATDIMIVDSYITPETPNKFVLSFFTSDSCVSKIVVLGKTSYDVSKKFEENHKFEIELSKLNIDTTGFLYQIVVKNKNGVETKSDITDVAIPKGVVITPEEQPSIFMMCCLGGVIFGLPSPAYVFTGSEHHWAISKEIPLFSFYSVGYNYPMGYLGIEYTYVFESQKKNFFRVGYKHIFQVPEIKYVSPGIDGFTDFKGYNGMSLELSVGLFQIQNVFTFYTRYRYNFQLVSGGTDFNEFSIGLYSNFFSLNL